MQQLIIQQHKLMLQNNEIMFKKYLEMRVIEQSHTTKVINLNYKTKYIYI